MKYIVKNLKSYEVAFQKWDFLPGTNEMDLNAHEARLISSSAQFEVEKLKKSTKKKKGEKI